MANKKNSNRDILQKDASKKAGSATGKRGLKQGIKQDEKMPLGKINFILIGACAVLIVLGFILMSGSANEGAKFNADIFSNTRTVVAPMLTFAGFVLMVWAILYRPKKQAEESEQ